VHHVGIFSMVKHQYYLYIKRQYVFLIVYEHKDCLA